MGSIPLKHALDGGVVTLNDDYRMRAAMNANLRPFQTHAPQGDVEPLHKAVMRCIYFLAETHPDESVRVSPNVVQQVFGGLRSEGFRVQAELPFPHEVKEHLRGLADQVNRVTAATEFERDPLVQGLYRSMHLAEFVDAPTWHAWRCLVPQLELNGKHGVVFSLTDIAVPEWGGFREIAERGRTDVPGGPAWRLWRDEVDKRGLRD